MKSKLKRNIFLIITFITVSFFSASTIYLIEQGIHLQFSKNDFLSQEAVSFKIECENKVEIKDNLSNLDEDYLLLKNNIDFSGVYGIYVKGEIKKFPQLIKGRFFKEDDFNKGEKVTVIGKGLADDIINKNGEDYYYIENDYYKVIGVLGDEEKETTYDYNVYINFDYLANKDSSNLKGDFIVDSGLDSKEIFNAIKSKYEGENIQVSESQDETETPVSKLISEQYSSSVLNIIKVLVILVFNTFLATGYWIKNRKKEMGIKRAIGANKLKISLSILGELIVVSIVSFLIGYSLYLIISYLKDGYLHFYFSSMIIVFIITFMSGILSSIVPIYKANKMEPNEIMR